MIQSPTPGQRTAIGSRAGQILLEAGAGTGKTTVLVSRYCDLIEQGESPAALLAFTFTEKAASQLRVRVRHELKRRAETADGGLKEHLEDASDSLLGGWITTIHGFCHRVLSAYAVGAGVDPRFEVASEFTSRRIRNEALQTTVERFLDVDDPDELERRREHVAAYGRKGLQEGVASLYDGMRSRGELAPTLPPVPNSDPDRAINELVRAAEDAISKTPTTKQGQGLAELLAGLRDPEARPEVSLDRFLAVLANYNVAARTDELRAVKDARETARRVAMEAVIGREAYTYTDELLRSFGQEFTEAKQRRGLVDFDDLQLFTTDLLTRSPTAGERFKTQFAEIMVDEFQDTSPSQVRLIEALRGPDTRLFEVGDEFQSIYAFRHADVESFRSERRGLTVSAQGSVLPLRGNFRSHPSLIATFNTLAGLLLPDFKGLTAGGAPSDADARKDPRAELIVVAKEGWDEAANAPKIPGGDPSSSRDAEAEAVAMRLSAFEAAGWSRSDMVVLLRTKTFAQTYAAALSAQGLNPYVIGGRGYWEGRDVGDAVSLLRSLANPLDDPALLGALASPACAVSPDCIWLLRKAAGRDRPAWPLLVQIADKLDCSSSAADPDSLASIDESELVRLREFTSTLQRLRVAMPVTPLGELVEDAISAFGLDLAVISGTDGTERWAALRKLIRLAWEFESSEGRDLRAFIDYQDEALAEGEEAEAVTAAEGHDGVRIMTIHAAKGLEFPVVAVPELGRRPTDGESTSPPVRIRTNAEGTDRIGLRLKRLGLAEDLFDLQAVKEDEATLTAEEEMRLFYVAITRAESRLLLSGRSDLSGPAEIKPSTPVIDRLACHLGLDARPDSLPVGSASPRQGLETTFEEASVSVEYLDPLYSAESLTTSPPRAADSEPTQDPALTGADGRLAVHTPPPRSPRMRLSFTAINDFEQDPDEYHRSRVLGIPKPKSLEDPYRTRGKSQGPEPGGAAFGTAVHKLLERALRASARRNRWIVPSEAQIRSALESAGVSPEPDLLARVREQIAGWCDSELCAEISEPLVRVRPEVPLLMHLDDDGDGLGPVRLDGTIDLLAEAGGRPPLIVDFKSNRLGDRSPNELADDYDVQRKIYALACGKATEAESVEVAYVLLERPNEPVRTTYHDLESVEVELRGRIAALQDLPGAAVGTAD